MESDFEYNTSSNRDFLGSLPVDIDADLTSGNGEIKTKKAKSLSCPAVLGPNPSVYGIHDLHSTHSYHDSHFDYCQHQQDEDDQFRGGEDVIELKGKSLSSPAVIGWKGNGPDSQSSDFQYLRGDYQVDDQYYRGDRYEEDSYDADAYRPRQQAQRRPAVHVHGRGALEPSSHWMQQQAAPHGHGHGHGSDSGLPHFDHRTHAFMGHSTEVDTHTIASNLGSNGVGSNYLYTVRFKNTTDTFSLAPSCKSTISVGDHVLVKADRGLDVGRVTEIYTEIMDISFVKKILSRASAEEVQHSILKEKDEQVATEVCRTLVARRGLRIAIADAEYQFDRKKLTFFFISER